MAADYIAVNKAKQLGNQLVRSADLLRELRELLDKLADVASHSFTTGDYTMLESNFGLAAGKGGDVATLLVLMQNIFNTSSEVTGAARLSNLDEYAARLAGQ